MYRRKAILLLCLVQLWVMIAASQTSDTALVNVQLHNNQATFYALLRPLQKMAGAPPPFYSYFWEFGDGSFSFEENPNHLFKDTGMYYVRLYATNNYDDGKPPPTRPRPVLVTSKAAYAVSPLPSFFKKDGAIEMKVNRLPRPDEDMVMVMGYRNKNKYSSMNGSLVLFYNEKQFRRDNFLLEEERAYHGEKPSSLNSILAQVTGEDIIPVTSLTKTIGINSPAAGDKGSYHYRNFFELIASKRKMFRKNNTWRFENLKPGEEKYFFLTLHTLPSMIKDTNAVVTLTGMFVPDNPGEEIEEYELELQVVTSHDPNRMMLKNRRLNYRFTGAKRKMEYKVRFQNTGKGPARQVSLHIGIPALLNPGSVQIVEVQPKCLLCDSLSAAGRSCLDTIIQKDSIHFVFKNIYLPGLRQQGFSDPDSTTGFVRYRIQFSKKPKKLPFQSNAGIVFDKNEPVYTNGAKGFFRPGKSPAVILGYSMPVGRQAGENRCEDFWMFGSSLSAYSPYKRYLQWELFVSRVNNAEQLINIIQGRDTLINGQPYFLRTGSIYEKSRVYSLHLVPLQLRYNLMDFLGAGAGTMITLDAHTKFSYRQILQLYRINDTTLFTKQDDTGQKTKWFNNWDIAAFADLQLLKVRVGPAVGVRFLHYFRVPVNHLMFYATWRL
jgi:hypothetical protein